MSPEQRQDALVQTEIASTAYRFLRHFYTDGNLTAAWDDVDPLLRLCWSQWWLNANEDAISNAGYELTEIAAAFVDNAGAHPLWADFERVLLRDFRATHPLDVEVSGIGATPRLITPGVEMLYAHRKVPEGGQWAPGTASSTLPIVLRHDHGQWQVLNLGYERIPEPGWPPSLW